MKSLKRVLSRKLHSDFEFNKIPSFNEEYTSLWNYELRTRQLQYQLEHQLKRDVGILNA